MAPRQQDLEQGVHLPSQCWVKNPCQKQVIRFLLPPPATHPCALAPCQQDLERGVHLPSQCQVSRALAPRQRAPGTPRLPGLVFNRQHRFLGNQCS